MTDPAGFLIRDGIASDIQPCLQLDHAYDTNFVWQLTIHGDANTRNITLRQDRLPREMSVTYPADEHRLRAALPAAHAFLIATDKAGDTYYGYLAMICDPATQTAHIHDLVVDKPYRRAGIGKRLLRVARGWATQKQIKRIIAETQTKNYPATQLYLRAGYTFCGFNDQYFDNQDIAIFFCLALN